MVIMFIFNCLLKNENVTYETAGSNKNCSLGASLFYVLLI